MMILALVPLTAALLAALTTVIVLLIVWRLSRSIDKELSNHDSNCPTCGARFTHIEANRSNFGRRL